MAHILIIGPDPEAREVLKLRFEVEGLSVSTALGSDDAAFLIEQRRPDAVMIDMMGYDENEQNEIRRIIKKTEQMKSPSVLLLPRDNTALTKTAVKLCDFCGPAAGKSKLNADLIVRKPYDLDTLIAKTKHLIANPKKSYSSHRGSRRPS